MDALNNSLLNLDIKEHKEQSKKLCNFYLYGNCKYGKKCRDGHIPKEYGRGCFLPSVVPLDIPRSSERISLLSQNKCFSTEPFPFNDNQLKDIIAHSQPSHKISKSDSELSQLSQILLKGKRSTETDIGPLISDRIFSCIQKKLLNDNWKQLYNVVTTRKVMRWFCNFGIKKTFDVYVYQPPQSPLFITPYVNNYVKDIGTSGMKFEEFLKLTGQSQTNEKNHVLIEHKLICGKFPITMLLSAEYDACDSQNNLIEIKTKKEFNNSFSMEQDTGAQVIFGNCSKIISGVVDEKKK